MGFGTNDNEGGGFVWTKLSTTWTVTKYRYGLKAEGWDEATVTMHRRLENLPHPWSASDIADDINYGLEVLPGFYPQDWELEVEGMDIAKVTILAKGIRTDRPYKIRVTSAAETQRANKVVVPGWGLATTVQTLEPLPVLEVSYATDTKPDTADVGTEGTPPYSTNVRASVWGSLTDPLVHFPSGWVLMDRPNEKLVGVDKWLVTDRWQYVQKLSPGAQ